MLSFQEGLYSQEWTLQPEDPTFAAMAASGPRPDAAQDAHVGHTGSRVAPVLAQIIAWGFYARVTQDILLDRESAVASMVEGWASLCVVHMLASQRGMAVADFWVSYKNRRKMPRRAWLGRCALHA